MDVRLNTAIWDLMVETDRTARYYGYLAGKLSRIEKWSSVATTVFAVVSVYSVANGVGGEQGWWALVAITASILTVAASVIPLVFRYGDAISSAAYCQTRLAALSAECKNLWLVRDTLEPADALSGWRELQKEHTEITAFQSAKPLDRKLNTSTRKETDAYWKKEAERLSRIAGKAREAVQAGQKQALSETGS